MVRPDVTTNSPTSAESLFDMPRRNSPNVIQDLEDLSQLHEVVIDKRGAQRAIAKKSRRNRHYEKQFIRNTLARLTQPRNDLTDD
jgi:hypothetical protein